MSELLTSAAERSRKAHSAVLQAMQDPGTQRNLANVLGVSESTISRIKTEKLEDSIALLYQLGFKLVSSDRVCVLKGELNMLRQTYARAVQNEQAAAHLFGGDE